ncbi:MAG: tRNA lysidine(34) synthetase TilS [Chitinophagaceae bacterium]
MNKHILSQQFATHWKQQFSLNAGEQILLAVSGGCDSMALAHLLLESGIRFAAAHCNFQLRGTDSDADATLVQSFAEENQISYHHITFNTLQSAANGEGIQETARKLRYEWFQELQQEFGYRYIATAHHADDNAETLLMHLARGTGLSGLHGIPVINGTVIRPLLFATRREIDAYIQANNITFREDASNQSDKYSRNAIRHHILPGLEKIYPQAINAINQSITRFTGAEKYYRKSVDRELKKLLDRRGRDWYIPLRLLIKSLDLPTILYELFTPFGFSPGQMQEIQKLLHASSGHFIDSATHRLIRDRDFFIVTEQLSEAADFILINAIGEKNATPEGTVYLSESDATAVSADNAHVIFVDGDKLTFPLILRRRKTGDYFYPAGFGMKKKKVSRFLIDKKIPAPEKDRIWILTSGKSVVWVLGHRSDERYKVAKSTKKIIRIEFRLS